MKKNIVRLFTVIFALLMILAMIMPVSVEAGKRNEEDNADDSNVVRVAFYEMAGFQYYSSTNEPAGYCVDYLNLISGFTGWKYEYIDVSSYSEALIRVENGDADIAAPIMLIPDWLERFDYSDYPVCSGRYVLICNKGDKRFAYEDIDSVNGMKIAVPAEHPISYEFQNYVDEHKLNVQIINYPTVEACVSAMRNNDVDCSVDLLLAIDDNDEVIAQFSVNPLFFVTSPENDEIARELDEAMSQVREIYAQQIVRMEQEYFPTYSQQFFTKEEWDFIRSIDTLRVAYMSDLVPVSFYNEKTGQFDGIARLVLDKIREITQNEFDYEFIEIPKGDVKGGFFAQNEIDIMINVENNQNNNKVQNMYMSIPYIETEWNFVSENKETMDRDVQAKVAICSGSQTFKIVFATIYPNAELKYYDSAEECFEALKSGEVDYLVDNALNIEYYLSKPLYSNFKVITNERMDEELCFATMFFDGGKFTAEECQMLMRIMDKALLQMSNGDLEEIITRETVNHRYEYSFWDTCYKYRYVIITVTVSVMVIISIGIYVIINNNRHIRKHKYEAAQNLIQKKRYELVMNGSDDMIYEIGVKTSTEVTSDKIRDTFGWEIPNKVDKLDFDTWVKVLHIHPDDEDVLHENYAKTLLTEGVENAIVQLKNLNNNDYLWCEVSVVPLYDEDGELLSIVGKISNVDANVRSIEAQGKELQATSIKNENLEELLANAITDNLADIMKLNLKTGESIIYMVKEGMVTEEVFNIPWDEYFTEIVQTMYSEDAIRISDVARTKNLVKQHVGTVNTYHYKAKYNIRKKKKSNKYHFYTTKVSIVEISGEKVAIITSVDDTEIMHTEDSYNEQREEFTSKLFESQRFLFNAIAGTYITTLKINLKNGKVYGMAGTKEGILEYSDLNVYWNEYLDKELIPFLDKLDVEKFVSQASLDALRERVNGDAITVSFKAKLDKDTLDPVSYYNWFVINFRVLEERGEPIATVIFQCDTENVQREILKNRERETTSRQKRLEILVDRTEDVVFEIDLENRECILTGRSDNLYGWELNRVIQDVTIEKLIELWGVHPEDRFVIGEAIQVIFAKEISVNKDVRIQKKNGTFIWSRISAVPVVNDNSEMTAIICKVSHISKDEDDKSRSGSVGRMDKLTGLLTQYSFVEVVEKYLRDHSAKNDAFIIIDMDQAKSINIAAESRISDKVLRDTARKLQIIFSNYDYIGKFEGDMFGVYVKNIPADTLEDKLEWAIEKLKDSYTYNGKIVQVSASIGVAYSMAEKATYEELYRTADETVYEAKKTGNGGFAIKRFF